MSGFVVSSLTFRGEMAVESLLVPVKSKRALWTDSRRRENPPHSASTSIIKKNNHGKTETNTHLSLSLLVSPQVNSQKRHTRTERSFCRWRSPADGWSGGGGAGEAAADSQRPNPVCCCLSVWEISAFSLRCCRTVPPLSAPLRALSAPFPLIWGR